jgi:hypothetical protein
MADTLRIGDKHYGLLFLADGNNRGRPDSGGREAAVALSQHLTEEDILDLARAKGLALGVLGSRWLQDTQGWLAAQVDLNTETNRELGFTPSALEQAPQYDDLVQSLGTVGLMILGRRRTQGKEDHLSIFPNIRKIGLMGSSRNPGFVPRYNRKQGAITTTRVSKDVWPIYGDRAKIHDPLAGAQADWVVAIELDGGLRGRSAEGNTYGERGILYEGLNTDDQRRILRADQEVNEFPANWVLSSMTVAHYIARCAQRRTRGLPLPDSRLSDEYQRGNEKEATSTTFVNYKEVSVARTPLIPAARTAKGQIELGRRPASGTDSSGIREVVQLVA